METTRRNRFLLLPVLLVLSLGACVKQGTVLHPGQLNTFDGTAYDSLITVQAALNEAKTHAGQFPQFKDQLNQAIASYNAAQDAYKTYHVAASGGTATGPQQAALEQQIAALVASVAKVETAFGVKLQ
jgi:hypothetical protein